MLEFMTNVVGNSSVMRESMRNGSVGFASQEDLSFLMDGNVSWKCVLETLQVTAVTANNIAT